MISSDLKGTFTKPLKSRLAIGGVPEGPVGSSELAHSFGDIIGANEMVVMLLDPTAQVE
jgi:hypothetical protein